MLVQIGDKSNLIYVNTDIIFGTVFPGENVTGYFIVHLEAGTDNVTYTLVLSENTTSNDMRPYLLVKRHKGVGDTDSEPGGNEEADGTKNDYDAEGTLDRNADPADTFDEWWVSFYVPYVLGDYVADIAIEPEGNIEIKP